MTKENAAFIFLALASFWGLWVMWGEYLPPFPEPEKALSGFTEVAYVLNDCTKCTLIESSLYWPFNAYAPYIGITCNYKN